MSPITSVILDPVAAYPFASTRIRGVSLDGIAKSHFAVLPARPTKVTRIDRKSTRLNSSHSQISYAVFCLKKKNRRPPPHGQGFPRVRAHHGHLLQPAPGVQETPRAVPRRRRDHHPPLAPLQPPAHRRALP